MNDSLDCMKREFYHQFNNLMGESVGFAGSADKFPLSPLSRMSRGQSANNPTPHHNQLVHDKEKDLLMKELQLENEELKRIVEEMKNEMEIVAKEIK
jgi:hypothetical protein